MNKELVEKAREAISNVHSDLSVSLEEVLEGLEELQSQAEVCCEAIESDIKNRDAE